MAKDKKGHPKQGSLFTRITTSKECQERGGQSWKRNDAYGSSADGKFLGDCYKPEGWSEEGEE